MNSQGSAPHTPLFFGDYFDKSQTMWLICSKNNGNKVTEKIDEWNKQGRYTDALLPSWVTETTEALADCKLCNQKEPMLKIGGL
ncbi:MAG: hypothetical protein P0116_13730 [Candidatus Nitrosocosmicus sp.]|nr:hypothetical protein [Candidatus Nitrosocosmicus sp.]